MAALLLASALPARSPAADHAPSAPVPRAPPACSTPWASTQLVARKGPLRAHIKVEATLIQGEAAAAAARDLAACPDADGRLSVGTCLVKLDSVTDAPFSAPRRTVGWLDLSSGAVQIESWQGSSHVLHRDCRGKRHSTRWRVKKKSEELLRTRVREAAPAAAGLPIVDGASLAWFASAHRLDREGTRLDLAAWSGDNLVPIHLAAQELVVLARRDQPSIEARRVSLTADSSGDDDDASVAPFGLTGDVNLWLEVGTGRILALEGHSVKIGHVRATNVEAGIR